jgi:hypothetical protein
MITFFVSCGHKYTHAYLERVSTPTISILPYDRVFRRRRLPRATYIFTDFDRLNFWELRLAALVYNRIRAAGWHPLNNPAQVRQRYALLRRLYEAGINQFGVYRVEAGEMPERYPVFLRGECAHQGPLTGLISDQSELLSAIESLVAAGYPERHLIVTEYANQPIRPNLYRKFTMYRIGDQVFPGVCVHEISWVAKGGKKGIAGQELYDEENAIVRQNPYGELLRSAFEMANISYGRADFGIVDGKVQIYEVNTNPYVRPQQSHPFPIRNNTQRVVWMNYLDGLATIDRKLESDVGTDCAILSDLEFEQHQRWWTSSESRRRTP